MIRKCIYTGGEAKSKDSIIPRDFGTDLHNWTSKAPVNTSYLELKQNRLPTELEMQANEFFHLLELAKLRVEYYELKLKEVQDQINKDIEIINVPVKNKKKDKQINKMIVEKEIKENLHKEIEESFQEKKENLNIKIGW